MSKILPDTQIPAANIRYSRLSEEVLKSLTRKHVNYGAAIPMAPFLLITGKNIYTYIANNQQTTELK
ncbi:hypothetical protein FAM09_11845 [Niastella caeni]|uniref:Uncharacterized protein n=1 Tax=Niastella caeni TaxID=2569763 RepID=A0A4S8HUG8_9BACT|nr:hypothetical protein [Niastella caeni]THU39200.1 hypothetical protein FAM09_11845 [Niastella caeni]